MALDKWWRQLGRPDPFYVIEGGAGTGTLAAEIIEAAPRCAQAMRYVAVERSAALRGEQAGRLLIQPPEVVLSVEQSRARPGAPRSEPLVATMPDLPDGRFVGVVLANELLDNLAVDLFERRGRQWFEVRVGTSREGGLEEVLVPLDEVDGGAREQLLEQLVPAAPDGARVPIQSAACEWLRRSIDMLELGRVVVFDYVRTTRWMSRHGWEDWMRTYRGHRPGGAPLDSPGTQDITCEVAVDQLALVRALDCDRSQAEFLESHGLLDLMADAREIWHSRAAIGDLGAARARGRVQEGRALTDPQGLGRFRVLEWEVDEPNNR